MSTFEGHNPSNEEIMRKLEEIEEKVSEVMARVLWIPWIIVIMVCVSATTYVLFKFFS